MNFDFVQFGQKLRQAELECDDTDSSVKSTLNFRGVHSTQGYALLERGTELSIRITCEENWAYEDDHVVLRLRVVSPTDSSPPSPN